MCGNYKLMIPWMVEGLRNLAKHHVMFGYTSYVWSVLCFSYMFLHAASSDATARLWSVSTGEDMRVYQGHHKATVCCALHDGADTPSWIEASSLIDGLSSIVFFPSLVFSLIVMSTVMFELTDGIQTLYVCTVTYLCCFSSFIISFSLPECIFSS